MKKGMANIAGTVAAILLLPIILLFLLCCVIILPFDYFKYKRTRYYKDTGEKYSLFCAMSYCIKLYELIKAENLPIDYFRYHNTQSITGYGYFLFKDILILTDYDPCFDAEKNIWTVEIEDEYIDLKDDVTCTIKKCNDFLGADVCKKAIVLIDGELYESNPDIKYEAFDILPIDGDNLGAALKKIIAEY